MKHFFRMLLFFALLIPLDANAAQISIFREKKTMMAQNVCGPTGQKICNDNQAACIRSGGLSSSCCIKWKVCMGSYGCDVGAYNCFP